MADTHDQGSYDKGVEAGKVMQRLDGHDAHFQAINGSIAGLKDEMHELVLAVQRLGDQAVSRDATVITTAAALKDADQARRDQSERSWSPLSRAHLILSVVGAAVGLLVYFTR